LTIDYIGKDAYNQIVPNPKTIAFDLGVTFAIFHANPIPKPQAKIHYKIDLS
jgi:hypothetical protein